MQRNAAQLIVDLGDILGDRALPDIGEASVELGSFEERIPLSLLQKHFNHIEVSFVSSDKRYALLNCKMSQESLLTFKARVLTTELELETKITETFKIPVKQENSYEQVPFNEESEEDEPPISIEISEDEIEAGEQEISKLL